MEALGVAVNVLAIIDLSIKVGKQCLEYAQAVKTARSDIDRFRKEVINLQTATEDVQRLLGEPGGEKLRTSQRLDSVLKDCCSRLQSIEQTLRPKASRKAMSRLGLRALKWPFQQKDLEVSIQQLREYTQTIVFTLQVDQTSVLLKVDQKVAELDLKSVLHRLPVASGASFDSHAEEHNPACMPNTRVELLEHISAWATDSDSEPIYWLNGMAGTGKSTICRTVAASLAESGHLGANFFFKRGEADRSDLSKFFTTLASQLVQKEPSMANSVKAAIDDDPGITEKASREQFDKLILEPLSATPQDTRSPKSLAVVVDALDECERDEDIRLLIELFSRFKEAAPVRLKIFITSRPELPIRQGFNAIEGQFHGLVLDQMPKNTIEKDIRTFFVKELLSVQADYNRSVPESRQLPLEWPEETHLRVLVQMAIPLFIFAATVCRSLSDRRLGSPQMQLKEILEFQSESQTSQLDATYLPILNRLTRNLRGKRRDQVIQRFKGIVGPIVLLENPLSISALSRLLDTPRETIESQLDMLHSVLSVPPDESPIRILHLSFRDFLVDSEREEAHAFWVDEKSSHHQLAFSCVRIMESNLHSDMCGLVEPGTSRPLATSDLVSERILPEVQYACLHWSNHMQQAEVVHEDDGPVHRFLLRHFLHWLEAMSLIGQVSQSLRIITSLQSQLASSEGGGLADFLEDGKRLVRSNISDIDSTPLQVYSSVLAFAPQGSIVRRTFQHHLSQHFSILPVIKDNGTQCLQVLEGHGEPVLMVAWSPDSKYMASSSGWEASTIRVWRSDDGQRIQEFVGTEISEDVVTHLAFSPDSASLLTVSSSGKVRLWNIQSGECIRELQRVERHEQSAVSPNMREMAIGKGKSILCYHITESQVSQPVRELVGHTGSTSFIVYSANDKYLVSACHNGALRVWNTHNDECARVIEGNAGWVSSVAISPNSALVAACSYQKLRVWDIETGECIQLIDRTRSLGDSVSFSYDSTLLASPSGQRETARVWRVDDGRCVQALKGHVGPVISVAFSPSSLSLASASFDETVRVWEVDRLGDGSGSEGPEESIEAMVVSPDLTLCVLLSNDGTQRVWDMKTGNSVLEHKGRSQIKGLIAFSPDSKLLSLGSEWPGNVQVWRIEDRQRILEVQDSKEGFSVVFSDGVPLVAVTDDGGWTQIWQVNDGRCIQKFQCSVRELYGPIAFSPNSALLAHGTSSGELRIWGVVDGGCTVLQGSSSIEAISWSLDSARIASGSRTEAVRVWRVDTGECIQEFDHSSADARSLLFLPDSKTIASTHGDDRMMIWQVGEEECIQEFASVCTRSLRLHPNKVDILADRTVFSPGRPDPTDGGDGPLSPAYDRSGLGISDDGHWITWKGKDRYRVAQTHWPSMLWGLHSAVTGSIVVMCRGIRPIIIRYKGLE